MEKEKRVRVPATCLDRCAGRQDERLGSEERDGLSNIIKKENEKEE